MVKTKVDLNLNQSTQARTVASEVQRVGVVDAAKSIYTKCVPTAKEMYEKYEPVAEQYAVSAWRTLNRLPLFAQVDYLVVPTAAYWSEKYNVVVYRSGKEGWAVASYLPLIPTDRITKVFEEGGKKHFGSSNRESAMKSESDFSRFLGLGS